MNRTTTYRHTARGCLCLVTALFLLGGPAAMAEFEQFRGQPTNQLSKRDNGSARVLTGKVVLAHIFVSDPESDWPGGVRREVRGRVRQALDFIRREAARYERPVVFRQTTLVARCPEPVPTELSADSAWTQQAIQLAAGESANQLVERLRQEHQADHVLIALHVNKPARSHNLTFCRGIAVDYRAERIVCFTRYEDDRPTAAASYAHEILHGFGAGELYYPFDKSDARRRLGGRWFPNDVMYRVDYDLNTLEIGPYTAFRIGWRDSLPDKYNVLDDPN